MINRQHVNQIKAMYELDQHTAHIYSQYLQEGFFLKATIRGNLSILKDEKVHSEAKATIREENQLLNKRLLQIQNIYTSDNLHQEYIRSLNDYYYNNYVEVCKRKNWTPFKH
jgi:uncharacterized protein YicC (UPF0701 family)